MSRYTERLSEALTAFESLSELEAQVQTAVDWSVEALQTGGKLLICGNGGSASEAQHLAGELVGRYKFERHGLPAIALTADSAVLTCIGNDYHFEDIFVRQIHALGRPGDILVAFSTSGNSTNVINALVACREMRMKSIAFLGRDGGMARELSDNLLLVRHSDTARVQEAHQFLMHSLMDGIEERVIAPSNPDDRARLSSQQLIGLATREGL